MGDKIGKDVYTTDGGDRIFVGPDVTRYEREDGGEVIVVEPAYGNDAADRGDSDTD
jgi:hypothetical protein